MKACRGPRSTLRLVNVIRIILMMIRFVIITNRWPYWYITFHRLLQNFINLVNGRIRRKVVESYL